LQRSLKGILEAPPRNKGGAGEHLGHGSPVAATWPAPAPSAEHTEHHAANRFSRTLGPICRFWGGKPPCGPGAVGAHGAASPYQLHAPAAGLQLPLHQLVHVSLHLLHPPLVVPGALLLPRLRLGHLLQLFTHLDDAVSQAQHQRLGRRVRGEAREVEVSHEALHEHQVTRRALPPWPVPQCRSLLPCQPSP